MTVHISIRRKSHFINGGCGRGVTFRPYLPEEHCKQFNGSALTFEQLWRIEGSPEEPGDVAIDLGTDKLNIELVKLLNRALANAEGRC
jgi:hypothetical protein